MAFIKWIPSLLKRLEQKNNYIFVFKIFKLKRLCKNLIFEASALSSYISFKIKSCLLFVLQNCFTPLLERFNYDILQKLKSNLFKIYFNKLIWTFLLFYCCFTTSLFLKSDLLYFILFRRIFFILPLVCYFLYLFY